MASRCTVSRKGKAERDISLSHELTMQPDISEPCSWSERMLDDISMTFLSNFKKSSFSCYRASESYRERSAAIADSRLSTRYQTKLVRANQVYNEYIQDKNHLHMNSTRWVSLTEFVKYLGREGIVRAEENEKGWWISWVDNSPKSLARQAESQKRERADMDDEQRQRKQLKEQIERAQMQAEALRAQEEAKVQGLQRDEGAPKVSLSISLGGKKSPDAETRSPSVDEAKPSADVPTQQNIQPEQSPSSNNAESDHPPELASAVAPAAKVSIGNPLKRPAPGLNVFKQANKSAKTTASASASRHADEEDGPSKASVSHLAGKKFLTAAEKLMLEDMERKKRAGSGTGGSRGIGYQGMGPSRGPARR